MWEHTEDKETEKSITVSVTTSQGNWDSQRLQKQSFKKHSQSSTLFPTIGNRKKGKKQNKHCKHRQCETGWWVIKFERGMPLKVQQACVMQRDCYLWHFINICKGSTRNEDRFPIIPISLETTIFKISNCCGSYHEQMQKISCANKGAS